MNRTLFDISTVLAQVPPPEDVRVERRLEFANLPEGWLAVISAAVMLAVMWWVWKLYRSEGRSGASAAMRGLLAVVRCVVLLLLAAIWLEPVLATYLHRWIESHTLVLIDTSASMSLRDQYRHEEDDGCVKRFLAGLEDDRGEQIGGRSRLQLAQAALEAREGKFLARLAQRNQVEVCSFDDDVRLLRSIKAQRNESGTRVESLGNLQAQGAATNVGRAIRRMVEGLGNAPVAAVVLLGDGAFNQGEAAETVGQFAGSKRIPVYTVGIGDPAVPRNVRLTDVTAPSNVFVGDPFAVTVHLCTTGIGEGSVPLELVEKNLGSNTPEKVVERHQVNISGDGALAPEVFHVQKDAPSRYAYRVQVPPQEYETVTDDNAKQIVINVIEDRMRVLLVAGGPSWEYRFLTRLLMRDETFDLSCWLQSASYDAVRDGNTVIDHLPQSPQELFEYDAVILMDPDPDDLVEGWGELLENWVSHYGGGLLFTASRANTPRFMHSAETRQIVSLLPITLDAEADLILNTLGHYQRREYSVTVPAGMGESPVLNQGGTPAENEKIWAKLGGVFWHYPTLRAKPLATVLMTHSSPRMRNSYGNQVLLATQFVGAGRTGFLGFDGTWRWRRFGEKYFERFWVGLLRHLIEGKMVGGQKRGVILTESETYSVGEAISVSARLSDANYDPLNVASISARFAVEDQPSREFALQPNPQRLGWYEGRFVPDRTGTYKISLRLPGRSVADDVEIAKDLMVVQPNLETLRPQMNRAALQTLAERSDEGRYFEIDQAGRIPDLIEDRHESTTVKGRPTELWDRWWMLLTVCGLLMLEWGLRKWSRLL